MKIPEKVKTKREKVKKKPIAKEKKGHVLIVAQEIKFARLLSGNEKKTRDRVLIALKKWLHNCFSKGYEFKESDFIRIWKGLFYAVWMSDKPLIQEELCESIAETLDHFPPQQMRYAVMMMKAGFHTLAKEWYGIDQHRMDKFLMLVRRYLRGCLRCLKRAEWSDDCCQMFADMLGESDGILSPQIPQYARNSTSMILHFLDCYLEEISKVSTGSIPPSSLHILLTPICTLLILGTSPAIVTSARRCLTQLIRQSETGIEYNERMKAWENMGCPEGGPDALELDEASDDDDDEQTNGEENGDDDDDNTPLDPRAGRINVTLSPLPVPATEIAGLLKSLLKNATGGAQRRGRIMAERFATLASSNYPYKLSPPSAADLVPPTATDHQRGADNLRRLEKTLVASSDELALRGLTRKHRKRLLAKARAGISIVDEVELVNNTTKKRDSEWQVDSIEPPAKKPKQDTDTEVTKKNEKKKRKRKKNKTKVDTITNTVDNGPSKPEKVKEKKAKNELNNKKTNESQNISNKTVKDNKIKENSDFESVNKNKKVKLVNGESKQEKKHDNKLVNGKQKSDKKEKIPTKSNKEDKKNSNKVETEKKISYETPKKVKFVLKNNCMQGPVDYYKSVRQSPNIPYDGNKQPSKTNLKVSTPSPINPFFKKKMKIRKF